MQEIVSSEWLEECRMSSSKRQKLKQKLWVCRTVSTKVFGLNPAEMIENPRRLLVKELKKKGVCVHFWERAF